MWAYTFCGKSHLGCLYGSYISVLREQPTGPLAVVALGTAGDEPILKCSWAITQLAGYGPMYLACWVINTILPSFGISELIGCFSFMSDSTVTPAGYIIGVVGFTLSSMTTVTIATVVTIAFASMKTIIPALNG